MEYYKKEAVDGRRYTCNSNGCCQLHVLCQFSSIYLPEPVLNSGPRASHFPNKVLCYPIFRIIMSVANKITFTFMCQKQYFWV